MELRLTEKEEALLLELLRDHHTHLLREIAKADHHDFKSNLRHRCDLLEGIMSKLQVAVH